MKTDEETTDFCQRSHEDPPGWWAREGYSLDGENPRSLLWLYVFGALFWALVALGLWLTIR